MTGVGVAPVVFHVARGGPCAAGPSEVAMLVAALRAVTELVEGRAARGETRDPAHRVVAHAARATKAAAPRTYAGVGRNEPCPCGSGKKFKRCHLGAVEAAPPAHRSPRASLHERDDRLVGEILDHGKRRFGAERIRQRLSETLGDSAHAAQLVLPWLAYVLLIDGAPLGKHFLQQRGANLATEDRRWIERQLETSLGVWEILRVERGRGFDAVDLLTGQRCFIHEVKGSETLVARDALLARVVADEVAVFCGVHETPLDPASSDDVVTRFGEASTRDDGAASRLLELWGEQAAARGRRAATPVKFINTDGHAAVTVEDRLALREGSFDAVFDRLAALDGAYVEERDRTGARFTFTREANAMNAHWPNTIVGSARLTSTRLIVETNSIERAEALIGRLRETLGELARWTKQTRTPLPEALGGTTVALDGQRLSSPAEASVVDASRAWLDQPITSLGGRTPREAAREADRRHGVHLLLKQQENMYARKPLEGVDPPQLRRELGLDELGQPLPNAALVRAMGAGRKLSETMLDFARPMIDEEVAAGDVGSLRRALDLAIAVWNEAVTAAQAGEAVELDALRRGLAKHRWLPWVDRLLAREQKHFGGDRRIVGDWDVVRRGDRLDVQMETLVGQELRAELAAAGML